MTEKSLGTAGIHLQSPTGERALALLTVPSNIGDQTKPDWQSEIFRCILREVPIEVEFLIAGHSETLQKLRAWPEIIDRHVELLPVPPGVDFTAWCQDPFIDAAARSHDDPVFLLPAASLRIADLTVAQIVAKRMGARLLLTPAQFEGGNVLVGGTFILVGRDTGLLQSAQSLSEFLKSVGETRPIHVVGRAPLNRRRVQLRDDALGPIVEELYGFAGSTQPIFHLDAFISLAGTGRDGRVRVLVGDPQVAADAVGDHPLISKEQGLAAELDEIASVLEHDLDCDVIRNPLPIIAVDDDGFNRWSRRSIELRFAEIEGLDDVLTEIDRRGLKGVRVRRWCLATQNSALVFDGLPSGPSVLLPSYADGRFRFLAASEQQNAMIWSQMGYRVKEIPGFSRFAPTNGSAHCLLKLLSRRPYELLPAH